MPYVLFDTIAGVLRDLAGRLETLANALSFCADCGQNRYTGKPCKNV
jgi:hypothetical protein